MTRSLPPLSPQARALLSAERDILPRPEQERRRAALRARTALWHARQSAESWPHSRSALVLWWKRGSLAAVALLGATSAFAAWVALEPAGSLDSGATVVESPAQRPVVQGVPPRTSLDSAVPQSPSAGVVRESNSSPPEAGTLVKAPDRGQTQSAVQNESKPAGAAPDGTPSAFSKRGRSRPVSTNAQGTSSEELALLDRARRAAATGDFRTALQIVERHARSFPNSQLGEEREALRVRALAGAGLASKAGEAARDFESRYPKSVLAPELQKTDRTTP